MQYLNDVLKVSLGKGTAVPTTVSRFGRSRTQMQDFLNGDGAFIYNEKKL